MTIETEIATASTKRDRLRIMGKAQGIAWNEGYKRGQSDLIAKLQSELILRNVLFQCFHITEEKECAKCQLKAAIKAATKEKKK